MVWKKINLDGICNITRFYFIPSLKTFYFLIKIILKGREYMLFCSWLYQVMHFSVNTKVTGTKAIAL